MSCIFSQMHKLQERRSVVLFDVIFSQELDIKGGVKTVQGQISLRATSHGFTLYTPKRAAVLDYLFFEFGSLFRK